MGQGWLLPWALPKLLDTQCSSHPLLQEASGSPGGAVPACIPPHVAWASFTARLYVKMFMLLRLAGKVSHQAFFIPRTLLRQGLRYVSLKAPIETLQSVAGDPGISVGCTINDRSYYCQSDCTYVVSFTHLFTFMRFYWADNNMPRFHKILGTQRHGRHPACAQGAQRGRWGFPEQETGWGGRGGKTEKTQKLKTENQKIAVRCS